MEITEVRITKPHRDNNLKAFASVCFDDCFVVNDFKIIETENGFIVCMPSKKTQIVCPSCGQRVDVSSRYCTMCAAPIPITAGSFDRRKDRNDIAHPIKNDFRLELVDAIMAAYQEKEERALR